jgi:uncharacterized protein
MMRIPRLAFIGLAAVAVVTLSACSRNRWPEPPAIDQAAYQKEYAAWQQEQQETIAFALPIVGIWPLNEGDTPFGTDGSLPIALPASAGAARAGVLQRAGDMVTVAPAPGVDLRRPDGSAVGAGAELADPITVGSIQLEYGGGGDGSWFVMARDLAHPAAKTPPAPEVYALDSKWRLPARFEAFAAPKMMKIADVRGGLSDMPAVGELVVRLDDRERRLVVFEGGESFFLMFKDATNGATTYGGYRILAPKTVKHGEFTVIDFNFAYNPPCAYSSFTTCPLPPRENTLDVAVEAGLKQLPSVKGWQG